MYQAAPRLTQKLFIGFIIALATLSARADQPPEILYATSPYTAILNLGVTNSELLANASVCDAAGNFYVTGFFEGIAKFGTNFLSSNGGYAYGDMYLVKYDPAGNVLWAKSAGGSGKDYGTAITLDGAGGIYVAGTSDSYPATFGTNVLYMLTQSLFIAHYDGNGNVLWVERGGATGFPGGVVNVNGIARDAANNVIVAGSFKGSPNFGGNFNGQTGNQTIYLTNHFTAAPTVYQDTFLAKFDASGSLLWAINPGGLDNDYANTVAVDSTGAIYTSGGYKYTNILGGQTYTNSTEGMFLAKFSSAGDLVWSSNLSDATNSNPGHGLALTINATDRITLNFQANSSSQPFAFRGTNYALAFGAINLLAQFDTNGNLYWLKQIGLLTGGSTLTVDKQNNLYVGGVYLINNVSILGLFKLNSNGVPLVTNSVPQIGVPAASVDDAGIIHASTTVVGDVGSYFTVGWTNIYPGFGGFGKDAIMFAIASNFVAVPPIFLQQPTNMVYQPPQGLTNSALARAWPAPKYFWYLNNLKLPSQTNFFLALGPTTFTNQANYFVVASNAYGLATSVVVSAQAALSFAPSPPTNIYVLVGTTLAISGGAAGITAITYQWQFKGTNIANATSPTLALQNLALNQSGIYTLVISNATGVLTSAPPSVVTVLPIGSVDPGYTNNFTLPVSSLVRLTDGTYYAANGYNAYHVNTNGLLATNGFVVYPYRWNDGSAADQYLGPSLVIRQPDDKVIVAGNFKVYYTNATTFTNASRIARLNPNGTLDMTFNVGVGPLNTIDGANYTKIESVIPLANGQYLVAGTFNQFNGLPITNLVRLNNDGSLDATFPRHSFRNTGSGTIAVHSMALQADGKLLLGGVFDVMDGVTNRDLTRLTTNGTVDATFVQTSLAGTQGNGDRVNTLLVLPDGEILAAGAGNYALVNRAARFNADGSRDLTWVGVLPSEVYCLTLTASNKLIFGCNSYVRRTTYDGVNDTNFNGTTGFFFTSKFTYAVVQEPSGNVMVGGSYGMRRLLLEPIQVVPTFSSGTGVGVVNGQFQISAYGGVDGQNVVVQASTDLVNWVNLSTNIVTGGCISYTDPLAPPLPNRYYRLTVQP
jgi:uncharacterized delta-60 repeat protein